METFEYDILVTAGLMIIGLWGLYRLWFTKEVTGRTVSNKNDTRVNWVNILLVLGAAFIFKGIMAVQNEGYVSDLNCFRIWSDMIREHGISKFYYIDEGNGYPPGYMFVLWIIALVRQLFGIETYSDAGLFMIKLVPMLCDLGAGFLIYKIAKNRFSEGVSLVLCLIYILSPAVLIDSSVWGQVDSVFTLMVILTCYLCMQEKRIWAYFVFCAGALLKFQMIMFAPILIFTIVEQVFLRDFNWKKFFRDLTGGLAAIGSMFVFAAPFGLDVVVPKYINSLELFEYCSVNAYNFWALVGKNWVSQYEKFLFVECEKIGTAAIVLSVLLSAFVFFKMKKDKSKYFVSMAVLISFVFLFSVRMHERYLFPALVLVLAGFVYRPCKELFLTYIGLSVVQYINVAHVFYTYQELETTGPTGYLIGAGAAATIFFAGYLLYAVLRKGDIAYEVEVVHGKRKRPVKHVEEKKKSPLFAITPSQKREAFTKWDYIVLFTIMIVYSCFALYDLGQKAAPVNGWESLRDGNQFVLDFGEGGSSISKMYVYNGNYEGRSYAVEVSDDGLVYTPAGTAVVDAVFRWNDVMFTGTDGTSEQLPFSVSGRYVRFTLTNSKEASIKEIVMKDSEGNIVVPENAASYPALFDEQDLFDDYYNDFRIGTYFDEIYHARTAYEMIHGLYNYENTHPPLGKFFISLGIRVFGMNPFGWRIVGVLFGIGMLPFMYLFGKRLFRQTWVAGVVTTLFAFDFMHFTQTRIATIDVYGTFFIIAMFYFMLRYAQTSFYDTEFKKTLIPLGLSGLMMGLGCASKWTAVYAGAGLGVFFFAIMFGRYMEYRLAMKKPGGTTAGISHREIIERFKPMLIKTLCACVVFFVLVPGLIYLLSYIPFRDGSSDGLFQQMINNQKTMFNYHSGLEATHPYSSTWYEWPTMIRPVFYYCNTTAEGLKEGISAFGNPLVWWAGIFAAIYMVYRCIKKNDRVSLFLVFAFLVQYLPWVLVPRCTFAYHYFPSVPFITLMIGYALYRFIGDNKKKRVWAYLYCAAAVGLFLLFYPVISGHPVAADYVNNGLKWLTGWVLIL